MPYTNVPPDKIEAMDSCREKVGAKQPDLSDESVIAMCFSSVVEGKELDTAIKEHQAGGMIGDLLTAPAEKLDPSVGSRLVAPRDVEEILEYKEVLTKTEGNESHPASHYLVIEDPKLPSTWHLRVYDKEGKLDPGHLGGAWAALTDPNGYRGNKYEGPGKTKAIVEARKLYASLGRAAPGEEKKEMGVLKQVYDSLKELFGHKAQEPDESLEEQVGEVHRAFYKLYPNSSAIGLNLMETFSDYVILEESDIYWKCPYTDDDNGIQFAGRPGWIQVEENRAWVEKAAQLKLEAGLPTEKAGARHNVGDRENLNLIHDKAVELGADCPMDIYKQKDGKYRWVLFGSNAYIDRDKEIVSTKAHEDDIAQLDKSNEYGPLRFWHMGNPSADVPGDWTTYKAGAGWDLGSCDYSAMNGRIRVESGTFHDNVVGEAFSKIKERLGVSQGFSHPLDEPDKEGKFTHIHTFERSLLPKGKQANTLAAVGMILKEGNVEAKKKEALEALIGADAAASVIAQAESTQKAAVDVGLRFKADAKIADWTASELKEYITKCMEGPMSEMKALFTKADGKTPEELEKIAKKEAQSEALDATVKATGETVQQIANAVNTQGQAFKVISEAISAQGIALKSAQDAIKSLTGDLPAGVVGGRVGVRASTDPNTVVALKEGVGPASDDFFSWAVRGPGSSAVGGTPPVPPTPVN